MESVFFVKNQIRIFFLKFVRILKLFIMKQFLNYLLLFVLIMPNVLFADEIIDFETGDFSQAPFNNEVSDYPWMISEASYEGQYSIKSSCEGIDDAISAIEVEVDVPADGFVGFYYRISSENKYDEGKFYIDGEQKMGVSAENDWTYKQFTVTAGVHTYRWEYAKDESDGNYDDAFYIDNISLYIESQPFSGGWLYYDNGEYCTNIGAGLVFRWAVMFPADDSYAGYEITKVSVYDSESNGDAESATITANVYIGGDNAPGTLVTSQEFTVTGSNDFVKVELENPVMLDGTENIWIVMECDELAFPASACSYMYDSNSNWLCVDGFDEWGHLSDIGMDYSWIIRVLLGDDTPVVELCSSSQEVKMFPNPTGGNLNVQCTGMKEIIVFMPNGQTVEKINVNNDSYIMNMGDYKSGVYYLKVTGDETIVKKVVKE